MTKTRKLNATTTAFLPKGFYIWNGVKWVEAPKNVGKYKRYL